MGSKVSHVEEEKQNLLEEVVGEKKKKKHAVKGGEREKLVCGSGTPLRPRHTSQHLFDDPIISSQPPVDG